MKRAGAPGSRDGSGLHPVTAVRVLSGTLGDEQRRELVSSGDLLVLQKVSPMPTWMAMLPAWLRTGFVMWTMAHL